MHSDSTPAVAIFRSVYVGGAGSIRIVDVGGNTVTFAEVAGGTLVPRGGKLVRATGTTATGIVGPV